MKNHEAKQEKTNTWDIKKDQEEGVVQKIGNSIIRKEGEDNGLPWEGEDGMIGERVDMETEVNDNMGRVHKCGKKFRRRINEGRKERVPLAAIENNYAEGRMQGKRKFYLVDEEMMDENEQKIQTKKCKMVEIVERNGIGEGGGGISPIWSPNCQ